MPDIPYQAYRSKRHSRNVSANGLSAAASISVVPPLARHAIPDSPNTKRDTSRPGAPTASIEPVTTPLSTPMSTPPSSSPKSSVSIPYIQNSTTKPTSTFRRVRHSKSPLSSSPLGLRSGLSPDHSRSPSIASTPPPSGYARLLPTIDKPLPYPGHALELRAPRLASSASIVHTSEVADRFTERKLSQPSEYLDLAVQDIPTHPVKPSNNLNGSAVASRSISAVASESPSVTTSAHRMSAPYRPGFQPKGVCQSLTDNFISVRRVRRDGEAPFMAKRVERTKLERRLEKLISLHFQLPVPTINKEMNRAVPNSEQAQDQWGLMFDLDSIRNMDAGSIWKSVVGARVGDSIRDAEQRIAPWQDDSIVNRCPLCDALFHPLTNRKHHCRLCGKIICALPPRRPHRPVPCSLLFTVDPHSRIIKEIGEGVDYGVKRRTDNRVDQSSNGTARQANDEDRFWKGVRICRECRPVILARKYRQELALVPSFVRLHNILIDLEHEIEAALPQFQELLLSLSHNDTPTKEASAARKRLLRAFGEYDTLSKQIYQLPCPNGANTTQQRIQAAVLSRANIFLQKNMFPLKSLPAGEKSNGVSKPESFEGTIPDYIEDLELAQRLQPLLEQEALLEAFVEEAEARRKFEDVKTLKSNLDEIRGEIRRLSRSADLKESPRGKT